MPEYAKMKNADLEALLKERGLPSAGKKADMVDRLVKDDENQGRCQRRRRDRLGR
jgi:SAP domain-containing ribonucleoprotein